MRARYGRCVAISMMCVGALIALMLWTPTAFAAPPTASAPPSFSLPFSGAPLRSEPLPRHMPSGQPRYPGRAGVPNPWLQLTHAPPSGFFPGSMMLLTDGTVLVHEDNTGNWEKLTPSSTGSYVDGTWSSIATMPSGYQPLYYASQILANGQMLIEGGEYNGSGTEVWTTLGALYNPVTDSWTSVNPPSGWSNIGDAQSVMLPTGNSGQFMMANIVNGQSAVYNSDGTWTTLAGTGKADRNDEEGYALLPTGKVLTINDEQALNNPGSPGAQVFSRSTNSWSNTANLPVLLPSCQSNPCDEELGPMVTRPNGTVFAVGGTDATATYNVAADTWTAGPTMAGNYDSTDGPASILPDGNVLFAASPGLFQPPTHFFVSDGSTLTQVADTTNAPNDPSYVERFLVLPTGQVMFDDGSGDIEIYNGDQTLGNSAWKPTITSLGSTILKPGSTYSLSGTQLSGLSGGAAYGDDNQSSTNFPLVRLTNKATGVVTYARTSGFSYSIASGASSTTQFTVPASAPNGPSTLQVVANGIPSAAKSVNITPPPTVSGVSPNAGSTAGGNTVTITGSGFVSGAQVYFGSTASPSVTVVSTTQIQAAAPAESAGLVNVHVHTGAGWSALNSADQYVYGPSTVSSVSPNAGSTTGGSTVTITGSRFVPGEQVLFGGVASSSVTVVSTTKIQASAPAHAAGVVNVRVQSAGGLSAVTTGDQYAYGAPTITSVSPNTGSTAGGNTVTITGSHFVPGTQVYFGSTASSSVTVVSTTQIQAVAPAHSAGVVNTHVHTGAGWSAVSSADDYTYS